MGAVFLHQLHDNLRSLRFQVSLAVLVFFFAANGVIYTMKMTRSGEQFARVAGLDEKRYERAETLSQAVDSWLKIRSPDLGIEFIAEAGSFWFAYARWLSPASGNTLWNTSSRTTNSWMRRFEVLDWTVIVRYVLSFLCIVLSYNAIFGELESGSLRLALATSLSRGQFLIGKFLGHLTTLMVATAIGSLISLAILTLSRVVEIDAKLAREYLFFLLGTGFYVSLFLLLGIGISALARNSAASLVLLIAAWTAFIVAIPQTSYLIAGRVTGPLGALRDRTNDYENEYRRSLEREGIGRRPREIARTDGYALEKRYAERMREMGEEMDRLQKDLELRRLQQYEIARAVNLFSPGFAFQYSVEAFLGTGIHRYRSFNDQVWHYRESLREFLRGRDAADAESPHVLFLADYMSDKAIDPGDLPRFKEAPVPFADGLAGGVLPICILVLEAAAAFFFALRVFSGAEISG